MGHRNGIFAVLALVASSLALAGMVYTDDYARAAQAEASGYHALTQQMSGSAWHPMPGQPDAGADGMEAR